MGKKRKKDYRVHGIQINWLGPMISTLKSDLKNMHQVPRYYQKCVNKFDTILADISGFGAMYIILV